MRILVTGSEGTLGKKLVAELLKREHEVTRVDSRHGRDVFRADVAEARQLNEAFDWGRPEVCYHLAAEFGRKNSNFYPEQMWTTNCLGTRNVIDQCLRYGTHLIFASSSEVYGDLATAFGEQTEDLPFMEHPQYYNEYALSKWTNEQQIEIAQRTQGLTATILRFFNAYGPGEEYNEYRSVVCQFIWKMLHNESITIYEDYHRVFMYVGDWVRTVAGAAARLDRIAGRTMNVGGEEYVSIEELYQKLRKLIPEYDDRLARRLPKEMNVTNKRPNNKVARELLGHACVVELDEGLPLTVDWMRENG